jgi:hypothetical protein
MLPGTPCLTTMSLDIAILGSDGVPKNQVSIDADTHHRLMKLLEENTRSLLIRMNDYYADAEYSVSELDSLHAELLAIQARCHNDERLFLFLKEFLNLSAAAKTEGKSVVTIPD